MEPAEFWKTRFVQYDTQARQVLDRVVQIQGITLTGLITVVIAALAVRGVPVLLGVPVVVVLMWVISIRLLEEDYYLWAYRDRAEERMADAAGVTDSLFAWRPVAGRHLRRSAANTLMYSALAGVSVLLIVACPIVVGATHPELLAVSIVELVVVGAVAVLVAIVGLRTWRAADGLSLDPAGPVTQNPHTS